MGPTSVNPWCSTVGSKEVHREPVPLPSSCRSGFPRHDGVRSPHPWEEGPHARPRGPTRIWGW